MQRAELSQFTVDYFFGYPLSHQKSQNYTSSKRNYAKNATFRMDAWIISSPARPALVNNVSNVDRVSLLNKNYRIDFNLWLDIPFLSPAYVVQVHISSVMMSTILVLKINFNYFNCDKVPPNDEFWNANLAVVVNLESRNLPCNTSKTLTLTIPYSKPIPFRLRPVKQ